MGAKILQFYEKGKSCPKLFASKVKKASKGKKVKRLWGDNKSNRSVSYTHLNTESHLKEVGAPLAAQSKPKKNHPEDVYKRQWK